MIIFITLTCLVASAESRIVGAFVMPHGGIALDPKHFETNNLTILEEAWALHNSCRSVGEVVSRLNPSVVFISTPHGIADLNSFLFYLNDRGYGSGGTDNCNCPPCCYNISVALDFELSSKLVSRLKELTSNVSGISGFGEPGNGALPFPLAYVLKTLQTYLALLPMPCYHMQ
jgi:hypothetical protein